MNEGVQIKREGVVATIESDLNVVGYDRDLFFEQADQLLAQLEDEINLEQIPEEYQEVEKNRLLLDLINLDLERFGNEYRFAAMLASERIEEALSKMSHLQYLKYNQYRTQSLSW
jgi:hypothetical protein